MLQFASCSSKKASEQVPVWVGSPYDYCNSKEEICGVGSGKSIKEADLSSKNELASFFKLQLNSNLESMVTADTKEVEQSFSQEQRESFSQVITSQVSEFVEGVEVIQRFILNDKEYFALARLKKNLLEEKLLLEIKNYDLERSKLTEHQARLSLYQLKNTLLKRQGAEKLLSMLDRPLIGTKKSENWWNETQEMIMNPKNVNVQLDSSEKDEQWKNLLESIITNSGHKITAANKARFLVQSSFQFFAEPINVDGFLKARIEWKAKSVDQERGNEVRGVVDESISVTARNKEQLWHRAKDHFKTKVLENIHLLNI